MAGRAQRAFILVIAIVFLVTSVGTSGYLLYDILTDDSSSAVNQEANTQQQTETQDKPKENSLEGTQLANYEPVDSVPELKIIDLEQGTGAVVKTGDTVTAHYTGALAKTGVIFQSSLDAGQPIPFSLNQVIEGWQKGVPGMKEGGTRRLLIPAAMAYGSQSPSESIPPNSDLVFDIQLVKIGE